MPQAPPSRWACPSAILVATDLSDLDRLIAFAIHQARESSARLILLHVLATGGRMAVDAIGMPYYDPSAAIDYAIKTLEPWRLMAHREDVLCDVLVREGNPADQIADAVRQFNIDRVFLGTRSRSKVSKLLLGSVAEQVLRSVNLPVITVGPEAHLEVGSTDKEEVVLHATTLRETSSPSAALAFQIASSWHHKLVLLHVLPPVDEMLRDGLPTGMDSTAMHELRILAAEIAASSPANGAQVEPHVAHGNPSIEILAASVDMHASLIVLGATHRPALRNLTRDRTIYRVLAHAHCPVLTLRAPLDVSSAGDYEQLASYI
jgi:nucleotide-binding universal stress UspA family protein